ncbi:hypothetical protein ACHQM5_009938 [Ranunculus cassubicifolius]
MASFIEDSFQEVDEDDELFEINLELANNISPAPKTGNVLLANCLLPVADVSCAVPANWCTESRVRNTSSVVIMRSPWSSKFWENN